MNTAFEQRRRLSSPEQLGPSSQRRSGRRVSGVQIQSAPAASQRFARFSRLPSKIAAFMQALPVEGYRRTDQCRTPVRFSAIRLCRSGRRVPSRDFGDSWAWVSSQRPRATLPGQAELRFASSRRDRKTARSNGAVLPRGRAREVQTGEPVVRLYGPKKMLVRRGEDRN